MISVPSVVCRLRQRAFLDVGHRPRGRGQLLLDGHGTPDHVHQLERGRAEQLPLRERRGGELHGAVEQGRQGPQVERLAVQLRDVLCLRGAVNCVSAGAGHLAP